MKILRLAALALSFSILGCHQAARDQGAGTSVLRPGDILFTIADQPSEQDLAIQQGTQSARAWAHNALVLEKDGELQVLEAAWPGGVHWTKIGDFMSQWGTVLARRPSKALSPEDVGRVAAAGVSYLGRPYDDKFFFSDDAIYCSELVWKAYHTGLSVDLCPPLRLKDIDTSGVRFGEFASKKWGAQIPSEEPMIANEGLWQSKYLDEKVVVVKGR